MFCQGVSHSAYFAGTYTWALGLYIVYMIVFAGFGAGSGIGLFLHTSPGLQIVMYLLWFHSMFGLASWMAVFYTDVITGTMAAVAALIFSGLVANLVVVQFVQSGPEWLAIVLEAIIPPFALFRALWEAGQYAFLANSTGRAGLSFSNINDRKNGIPMSFGLMAIHAVVSMGFAAWYSQVMGADADGEGLTGPRKHPYFFLGAKLGPDDPRGGAWFTYQFTLIPTRTRKAMSFLFTCIPRAVRWFKSSSNHTQESENAPPTDGSPDADNSNSALPQKKGLQGVLGGIRAKATNGKGEDVHVSAATRAAAAAVHRDMVSDDVRAEVEMVEELWDLAVLSQPGQHTHSLAELEHQPQQHDNSNSPTTTSLQNQRGGGRSVLTEISAMPVLLLRGVRKEFQLPQPFKLPRAPDLAHMGLCGKGGYKGDRQREHNQQQERDDALALPAPASGHVSAQQEKLASQMSRGAADGEGVGEGAKAGQQGANQQGVAQGGAGNRKQSLGAIGRVAAAPPASRPNVKVAVAGLWLSVRKAECFGLLGPNGAGKTTALRLMQGLLEPSAGRVAVCGKDLESEPQAASRLTGICPQHDALWPALSAEEHLQLYGRLRGLKGAELAAAVHDRLLELGLLGPVSQDEKEGAQSAPMDPADSCTSTKTAENGAVASVPEDGVVGSGVAGGPISSMGSRVRGWCSGSVKWMMRETATAAGIGSDLNLPAYRPISTYSGGMRRRLSVACALVGKSGTDEGATPVPAVAFLDEPAAGLDPASRSALWQAIRSARTRGTAIVLTTHSMAEAEALGDRLGIFVSGQMRALGSTQQLAARYAGSLLLSITTPPDQADAIAQVLGQVYPTASQVYSAGGAASWEIPRTAAPLSTIMASLRRLRTQNGPGTLRILDWGLTSASLDHVFATIVAACAEAEARKDSEDKGIFSEDHEGLVVEERGDQEEDQQESGAQRREGHGGEAGADPGHESSGPHAAALSVGPNNV